MLELFMSFATRTCSRCSYGRILVQTRDCEIYNPYYCPNCRSITIPKKLFAVGDSEKVAKFSEWKRNYKKKPEVQNGH